MNRNFFLKYLASASMVTTLTGFERFVDDLPEQDELMPVLFVGHGSPMNAIEDNRFSQYWRQLAKDMPTPNAVLIISAHWLTQGTRITAMSSPKTIHDFGGFPKALFDVEYKAPGNPILATETAALLKSTNVILDHDWGLDHGAWSVAKQMYPDANIPVLQLSIDYHKGGQYMYELAQQFAPLRKKGVLILGSGNMVHNLGMLHVPDGDFSAVYGYDWTHEINSILKSKIMDKDHKALINYNTLHKDIKYAIPTPDHYYPLLYTLALQNNKDKISLFNDYAVAGSLTMTSVKIG